MYEDELRKQIHLYLDKLTEEQLRTLLLILTHMAP